MVDRYYLMHGSDPAPVALIDGQLSIMEVFEKCALPLGVCPQAGGVSEHYLMEQRLKMWFAHRTIPSSRQFAEELRTALGMDFPELMLKNLSVSLTDTYWLCPQALFGTDALTWDQINFHQNGFPEAVSQAFLQDGAQIPTGQLHPLFTTDAPQVCYPNHELFTLYPADDTYRRMDTLY